MVCEKNNLLMISEEKLNFSLSAVKFYMKSYLKPYILQGNSKGGGTILYIREDFPSRFLKTLDVEDLLVECYFENKNGCSFLTLIPINPRPRDI